MHALGLGIPKDVPRAINLYKVAAVAGEFLAQIELGRIYAQGLGVPPDADEARRWYSAAIEEQDAGDCEELQEAKDYVAGSD